MKQLIKTLGDRFIRGVAGLLVLGTGLEVLDKTNGLKVRSWRDLWEAVEEVWRKERDALTFIAILGGLANVCSELAHCVSRKLYRTVRRRR
jgi:hypothetical protein